MMKNMTLEQSNATSKRKYSPDDDEDDQQNHYGGTACEMEFKYVNKADLLLIFDVIFINLGRKQNELFFRFNSY
jgi:hypothetical protein